MIMIDVCHDINSVLKKNGYIQGLTYDGVSLLGKVSGNAGQLYTGTEMFSLL